MSAVQVGSALTALVNGSMILTGKLCRCAGRSVAMAWDVASIDPEATAKEQTKADRAARAAEKKARAVRRKKKAEDDDQDDVPEVDLADVTADPVAPVRRNGLEALALFGLGAALAAGAVYVAWKLAGLALAEWWAEAESYRYLIVTGGGLAWIAAAWMLGAPPPQAVEEDFEDDFEDWEEDLEDGSEEDSPVEDQGVALLLHVITAVSDAEFTKKTGVHLDVIQESATKAGLMPGDIEPKEFRAWLEAAGLPLEEKFGQRIQGKTVTRWGIRVDALTGVLSMPPTQWLNARSGTPAPAPVETPVSAPAQAPVQVPVPAPVPAFLRLIPGGRQDPDQTLSPTAPQEWVQGTR